MRFRSFFLNENEIATFLAQLTIVYTKKKKKQVNQNNEWFGELGS